MKRKKERKKESVKRIKRSEKENNSKKYIMKEIRR